MATCVFIYNSNSISIPCNLDDKMGKVCEDFKIKNNMINSRINFYYFDRPINFESSFTETANELDIIRKTMTINVYNNQSNVSGPEIVKSKDIVCPACKKDCLYKIDGKNIRISCPDNHQATTPLTQFDQTQIIDLSTIKCSKCNQANKTESELRGTFYYCLICKENICHNCKSLHSKHKLIDFNDKKGLCLQHKEHYTSYCEDCKTDLCDLCESKHDKNHSIIQFKGKSVDIEELSIKFENFETKVNDTIKKVCEELNFIKHSMKFIKERIENYEPINKNYINLENINEIKNYVEKFENTEYLFANVFNIFKSFKRLDLKKENNIVQEFISIKNQRENLLNANVSELLIKKNNFEELKVEKINIIDDCHYIKQIKNVDNFEYIKENNKNVETIHIENKKENLELCIYNKNVNNTSLFDSQLLNSKLTSIQKLYFNLINCIHLYKNKKSIIYKKYIKNFAFFDYFNQFTSNILIYSFIFSQGYIFKIKYSFFMSFEISKGISFTQKFIYEIEFSICSKLKYFPIIKNNNNMKKMFLPSKSSVELQQINNVFFPERNTLNYSSDINRFINKQSLANNNMIFDIEKEIMINNYKLIEKYSLNRLPSLPKNYNNDLIEINYSFKSANHKKLLLINNIVYTNVCIDNYYKSIFNISQNNCNIDNSFNNSLSKIISFYCNNPCNTLELNDDTLLLLNCSKNMTNLSIDSLLLKTNNERNSLYPLNNNILEKSIRKSLININFNDINENSHLIWEEVSYHEAGIKLNDRIECFSSYLNECNHLYA